MLFVFQAFCTPSAHLVEPVAGGLVGISLHAVVLGAAARRSLGCHGGGKDEDTDDTLLQHFDDRAYQRRLKESDRVE